MRDILEELAVNEPLDPTEAARRNMRPALPRRFYGAVDVGEAADGGFAILLDGRGVRTPGRKPLVAPTRPLAEAIAAEWAGQGERIDPSGMPLTRLANSIIDGVAAAQNAVADEVAKYLSCDLLLYRAAEPHGLVVEQSRHWDAVLAWAGEAFGARFILAEGVMHVAQPEQALAALRPAIPSDPWRLGAVHSVTTLTGSALLALALASGRLTAEAAWTAAHVDEDWNMAQWGQDDLALERRAFRHAEMQAAARVLALS